MLTKITNYFKNIHYNYNKNKKLKSIQKQYGIPLVISNKLLDVITNTHLELTDSNTYISIDNTSVRIEVIISNLNFHLHLTDKEPDIFSDRIYIENIVDFCKKIKKSKYLEYQDLISVGTELSMLDISDLVAESLADVLVAWNTEFSNFYCYCNDTHAIMMWSLSLYEYMFVECNLNDSTDVTMYIETVNVSEVLNYLDKNLC